MIKLYMQILKNSAHANYLVVLPIQIYLAL